MDENISYLRLLHKMFLLEEMGKTVYNVLESRTKDIKSREIYHHLYLNEQNTSERIKTEIIRLSNKSEDKISLLSILNFIFQILPVPALLWGIKKTLKKRLYRKWAGIYIDKNREFWQILFDHEEEQLLILRNGGLINDAKDI